MVPINSNSDVDQFEKLVHIICKIECKARAAVRSVHRRHG